MIYSLQVLPRIKGGKVAFVVRLDEGKKIWKREVQEPSHLCAGKLKAKYRLYTTLPAGTTCRTRVALLS